MSAAAMPRSAPSGQPRAPEPALLLACARLDLSADEAARVRRTAASGEIDWSALLALATRHRLIPLLHRHLRDAPLPPRAAAELRALNRAATHQALAMAAELRRLLDALEDARIEALAYKGPALAMQAYGDLSLRHFIDLDLLVLPSDLPAALAVLERKGYVPALRLSPAQARCFDRVDGDYQLVHRTTGQLVELHGRVSTLRFAMPIDTDVLMECGRSVRVGGGEVETLGDDDVLLVLCVHGAKHRWKRLEWVAALAELLRAGCGDVREALRHASLVHARRTMRLGLSLAHRLLDAPLDPAVAREIGDDPRLSALEAEAEARMFGPEPEGDETAANLRFNLRARDSAEDAARSAARWLFAPGPEDWRWVNLPDALFPLYRALRPVRLLMRHGGGGR